MFPDKDPTANRCHLNPMKDVGCLRRPLGQSALGSDMHLGSRRWEGAMKWVSSDSSQYKLYILFNGINVV